MKFFTYTASLLCISTSPLLAKNELSPLTANVNIWQTSNNDFAKKFSFIDWDSGDEDNLLYSDDKNLTLWNENIEQASIAETDDKIRELSFHIVTPDSSLTLSDSEVNAIAKKWQTVISEKVGARATVIPAITKEGTAYTRVAWNFPDSVAILARGKHRTHKTVTLSIYEKQTGLATAKLRGLIKDKTKPNAADREELAIVERDDTKEGKEKSEIRKKIQEILKRPAPKGISSKVQDAVNLLNVYRYLSGVSYDVKAKESLNEAAFDAAQICRQKGTLSHGFGHSTDKCNLAMNSGGLTMANSVTQYMEDSGANNRAQRGHRRWCLYPQMGKTGFGIDGGFSAMYVFDFTGRKGRKNHAYPGEGFYPVKYLHGNGWSYHLAEGNVPAQVDVSVWKLKKYQAKPPRWSEEPDGKKFPTNYVNTYQDTVVFEPQDDPVTRRGTYLVRLEGRGFKEQYLVHLF